MTTTHSSYQSLAGYRDDDAEAARESCPACGRPVHDHVCVDGGGRPLASEAVVIEPPLTPCVVGPDGTAVPSDEQALCADCGARGWVSDWPGEGALCASAHGGDPVCDECEDAREGARETGLEVV